MLGYAEYYVEITMGLPLTMWMKRTKESMYSLKLIQGALQKKVQMQFLFFLNSAEIRMNCKID